MRPEDSAMDSLLAQLGEGPAIAGGAPLLNEKRRDLVIKRIRDIPSLPEVVNQILEKLGKQQTPASELARLVSYDPGLSSRVLRMVNSSAYGVQRQITSIQHGIMILGFNTVRSLVLSASVFKLMGQQSVKSSLFDQQQYWRHCILTAMLGRHIAVACRLPETDEAFSAGMLHDIGKLVLHSYFTPEYQQILKAAKAQAIQPHGSKFYWLEKRLLGSTHTEIGGMLATKWKLPASLNEVIQTHHQVEKATLNPGLVNVVALANELAVGLENEQDLEAIYPQLPEFLVEYFELESADELAFLKPYIEQSRDELDELLQQL